MGLKLLLVLSLAIVGVAAGGALASLTAGDTMGFEGAGRVMLGVLLGGATGIGAGIVAARRQPAERLRGPAVASALIAIGLLVYGATRLNAP